MRFRILLTLLPVLIFLGLTRFVPAWAAITGGFAATTIVFVLTRRERLIGGLALFGFCVVAVSALLGITWSSEKAYLASGPITDFLWVPLFLVSVAIRKPLVGGISRELVPAIAGRLPLAHPIYAWLSVAWAVFDALHGIATSVLLSELSVAQYIIWSRLVLSPFSGLLFVISAFLIYRRARRHGAPRLTYRYPFISPV